MRAAAPAPDESDQDYILSPPVFFSEHADFVAEEKEFFDGVIPDALTTCDYAMS